MSRSIIHRRRTPAGAAPGAFVTPSEGPPPVLRVVRSDGESVVEETPAGAREAFDLVAAGGVTWLDLQGIGDGALLAELGGLLGLHRLAVADVANAGQRPKVEDYGDVLFVVIRMVTADGADRSAGHDRWEQVSLFLGRGWVLTVQEAPGDCLDPVRRRLREPSRSIRREGADYLACMLLDAIVDGYFPHLERIGERLEELEVEVVEAPDETTLAEVYRMRRELMTSRRAAWPLRETYSQLLRDGHPLLTSTTQPYLRDTADHVFQVVDVIETYRELAASFVDVYLSSLANRTNEVMRVLTVLASIFVPLTFLAGVYGMNFDTRAPLNMPELRWEYGYLAFWGIGLALAATMLFAFRRLGWLGGPRRSRSGKRREAPR